jgi:hypothetical protein
MPSVVTGSPLSLCRRAYPRLGTVQRMDLPVLSVFVGANCRIVALVWRESAGRW